MNIIKKIMAIIVITIGVLIIGNAQNQVYAALGPSGAIELLNKGSEGVKEKIYFGQYDLQSKRGNYGNVQAYCAQHNRYLSNSRTTFHVNQYVEINGATGEVRGFFGNENDKYSGKWHLNGEEDQKQNKIFATILAANNGYTKGYGAYQNNTSTQKAVWNFFSNSSWVTTNLGSWFVYKGNYSGGTNVYNAAKTAVENGTGYKGIVKIAFLTNIGNAAAYQTIMIVSHEDQEVPPEEDTLTIEKIDIDSGKNLANVSFTVQCVSASGTEYEGQYIKNVDGDNKVTEWTTNESEAKWFTTGTTSYQKIYIRGIPTGLYKVTEVANGNKGYEENVGITWAAEVDSGSGAIVTADNKKKKEGAGNVSISGVVWEDVFTGKDNKNNNIKDGNDKLLKGIKVTWKSEDGTVLGQTETDNNGYYKMYQTIKINNHTYSIDQQKYNQLNNSYIEFEYNGLKYTTIAASTSGTDTSKGTESTVLRKQLDDGFGTVTRDIVKNAGINLKYDTNKNSSTLTALNDKEDSDETTVDYNKNSFPYAMTADTQTTGIKNLLSAYAKTESSSYCIREKQTKYGTRHTYGTRIDEWHVSDMNLGLVRREQPDIALTSDIEKVDVIMKGQKYTYKYGNRGISANSTTLFDYKVKFQNVETDKYFRPVNPADIAYVNDKQTDELKVYVTYNIIVKNQSSTLSVDVQDIVNYYDKEYQIVSDGWTKDEDYSNDEYQSAHNTSLKGVKLKPGETSEIVKIEFEVSQDAIKGLQNNKATLKNVSEIYAYSSWYGENTKCAENKTGETAGKVGDQYAGIDVDSAPGSAIPGKVETYEDDTDQAPSFVLYADPNYKLISGTVWEDTITDQSKEANERLGDGEKSDQEKNGVQNVKVELLKVNDDGTLDTAKLYKLNGETIDAIVYTDENGNYSFGKETEYGVVADNYILKYTYGNGKIDENDENRKTAINGSVINARNYKSTIITDGVVKGIMTNNLNGTVEERDLQWHLNINDNRSVAIDNIQDLRWKTINSKGDKNDVTLDASDARLKIDSLKNGNFDTGVNVSAYSLPFKVQLEYTKEQSADVNENGNKKEEEFLHNWTKFDFGIMERAREDIYVDKTIDTLKITLANGQVLTEGNPYSSSMNYVRAFNGTTVNDEETFNNSFSEKAIYMEMDSELIQGATLEILYKITVTNNSEKDYVYSEKDQRKYYYYGEEPKSVIKQSVEYLVDYVDKDLTCEAGDGTKNAQWEKIDVSTLEENGQISEDAKTAIDTGNYKAFITEEFKNIGPGESHSETLYVSKLLANQEDDHVYENHTEIIQLDPRIARTIKETNEGMQISKNYIPGDYLPSTKMLVSSADYVKETRRLHEQDDSSIKLTITPPTGLLDKSMIYIVAGTIGLIVIGIGIYIIRKKIIK